MVTWAYLNHWFILRFNQWFNLLIPSPPRCQARCGRSLFDWHSRSRRPGGKTMKPINVDLFPSQGSTVSTHGTIEGRPNKHHIILILLIIHSTSKVKFFATPHSTEINLRFSTNPRCLPPFHCRLLPHLSKRSFWPQ